MPSELTKSVRAALSAFVASRSVDGDDVPADILRVVRDEASNLLERQLVWDAFDADPFKLCEDDEDVRRQIRRAKGLMNVISCSRCTTKEGYSSIRAVVELSKDGKMRDVADSLRLSFSYERNPILYESETEPPQDSAGDADLVDKIQNKGTQVTYTIDLSRDHGEMKRLITVEVVASGEFPSAEEAIPMEDDDEWEEFDEEGSTENASVEKMEEDETASTEDKPPGADGSRDECEKEKPTECSILSDGKDRYSAFVDPEVLGEFLTWTRLEFEESTVLFFLMTFPFFEHEWDLMGFLLDAVFGGDEDGDEMSDGQEEEGTA